MKLTKPSVQALQGVQAQLIERLSPRQRQYLLLFTILLFGVGLLWLMFALADSRPNLDRSKATPRQASTATNIGVMPPGSQLNPVDQWVGNAGRKLAQYENEREEQGRMNKERQAFESKTLQRFAELEQKLTTTAQGALTGTPSSSTPTVQPPSPAPVPAPAPAPLSAPTASSVAAPWSAPTLPTSMPPAASLPMLPQRTQGTDFPPGTPAFQASAQDPIPEVPSIVRITLVERSPQPSTTASASTSIDNKDRKTVATYLPVSFTRGKLLGGLDAPTGGQAQSNPHPVLIRLSDNSVLPNRFRGEYRECFVVAAGYGDISSERAYLRTENLSCVRSDGATLEVKIQGSIYGEDGKVGMRGRLVTKQGQMLANALLAGVVSGIGQGVANASTNYSTSALGTVATASGNNAYRAGVGTGVGRALDRLAQYYIKLAENTFPVIEIDGGREVDVVITKGVRIDVPMTASTKALVATDPQYHYLEASDDENY